MVLDPQSKFSWNELERLVDLKGAFKLHPSARRRVAKAFTLVQKMAHSNKPIYGVNTGFGKLATVQISKKDLVKLQLNFLRSHAGGIGDPLSPRMVRRLLLLRILSLGKGHSGISWELLERHLIYLNKNLTPRIPEQGSVGASGDLAPLAHLGLTFIGEGEFCVFKNSHGLNSHGLKGERTCEPALKVLRAHKLKPLSLHPKEGLALVNGMQFSLALALEVWRELQELLPWMEWAACLSVEAHRATDVVFRADLHRLKAHSHQQEIAKRFAERLRGSKHMKGHKDCNLVQDAYSFRCIPQILGSAYALLDQAKEFFESEINSVSDNPVLVGDELLSGGHFHGQYVSAGADLLALAMATVGNLIERRIDQLMNPGTTRGRAFFADRPGIESGLMIIQTAAAALASENKTLAHPASIDTIPTSGNQEDHVSMAPWAARKALMMVENLRKLIAAEILVAVRGCVHESTRTGLPYSQAIEKFLSDLAPQVPEIFLSGDRVFGDDWRKLENYIRSQNIKFL